jgi:ER lumen protein retaining receptor
MPHCHRYFAEDVIDPIAVTAGIVQTGLYLDFFYVYVTKYVVFGRNLCQLTPYRRVLHGQKFELPA